MGTQVTGPSKFSSTSPASGKAKDNSGKIGKGGPPAERQGSWVREDGAICFDNECITLKPTEDGALDLTYDPDKCSCEESNTAILEALMECAMSGKGIRLEIKPKAKPKSS